MKHGSLFSGIGGFDLASDWMGWENIFHCEINPFSQKVLKHYWPSAISYHDIKTTDFTIHKGSIDILTGGFPCQPYSAAGKRLGKEDDRHLWPEMLRAIREIQPTWVVGENVRGLTNWNGGVVFDEVQADLEAEGYEVLPFLLPACAVNAPHRRDRIWFIAYFASNRRQRNWQGIEIEKGLQPRPEPAGQLAGGFEGLCNAGIATNTPNKRLESREQPGRGSTQKENGTGVEYRTTDNGIDGDAADTDSSGLQTPRPKLKTAGIEQHGKLDCSRTWENFPTVSPLRLRDDGLPSRLAGITFSKHRNESIKAYGNAIVPAVAHQIFKAINEINLLSLSPFIPLPAVPL